MSGLSHCFLVGIVKEYFLWSFTWFFALVILQMDESISSSINQATLACSIYKANFKLIAWLTTTVSHRMLKNYTWYSEDSKNIKRLNQTKIVVNYESIRLEFCQEFVGNRRVLKKIKLTTKRRILLTYPSSSWTLKNPTKLIWLHYKTTAVLRFSIKCIFKLGLRMFPLSWTVFFVSKLSLEILLDSNNDWQYLILTVWGGSFFFIICSSSVRDW